MRRACPPAMRCTISTRSGAEGVASGQTDSDLGLAFCFTRGREIGMRVPCALCCWRCKHCKHHKRCEHIAGIASIGKAAHIQGVSMMLQALQEFIAP